MERIITKLVEIEEAASRISEAAGNLLKEQDRKQQERIRAFDRQLEADTEAQLEELKGSLEASHKEELRKMKEESADSLAAMDRAFDVQKEKLAEAMFQRIIRKD